MGKRNKRTLSKQRKVEAEKRSALIMELYRTSERLAQSDIENGALLGSRLSMYAIRTASGCLTYTVTRWLTLTSPAVFSSVWDL